MTAAIPQAAGASALAGWAAIGQAGTAEDGDATTSFRLFPIGEVEKSDQAVGLRIFDQYVDGLLGLEGWSHANVLYWFDQNDTPPRRRILRVHPRGDRENPLTGVFACRAAVRPNLIALSVAKILSVEGNLVTLDDLDAFAGTPILDLKPFIPPDAPRQDVRVPAWARQRKPAGR